MVEENYVKPGAEYVRDAQYVTTRITRDGRDGFVPEAGRYRLIAARACPWASRQIVLRRLLGLEEAISLGLAGPVHDVNSWTFDLAPGGKDPVLGYERLQQAYFALDPDYPLGITVPAWVDTTTGKLVSNDFRQLEVDMIDEWADFHRPGAPDLYPAELREEIDAIDSWVYRSINNGVYRCGFAGSQESYDKAYAELFDALDRASEILGSQRYLVGDHITLADIRLAMTLFRFDPVYHGHFKTNRSKLAEMPVLWAYSRDLFQTPGIGDTVDFVQIKQHYYLTHRDVNPSGVMPQGPELENWLEPHGRKSLGGSPFGAGTAPGPVSAGERVPEDHTPLPRS
ncbi:glutathione S-transferase family protein [Parenemella sanctibonifatiensis]|uniref:Glutathione-dependent reductase n=1 Tax=Parenemella sanctibonifatiensis TaxID=2016505 RepID=A0A255EDN3_9ACTN|nr:glutathione S-transferase C-terminal domain-containing protein [Parenemella sanctibonifatiensis]OYN89667.1 glutathione-dependent reductase [Parenemella sanctibonifatiensis]